MTRAQMHQAGFRKQFWPLAHSHSVQLYNLRPQRELGWRSPMETLLRKDVDISALRTFGCDAIAYVDAAGRDKLDPRGEKFVHVGNDPMNLSSYKLLDPRTGKVVQKGMVTFQEQSFQVAQQAGLTSRAMLDCNFELTLPPGDTLEVTKLPVDILDHSAHLHPQDQEIYAYFMVHHEKLEGKTKWVKASGLASAKGRKAVVEYLTKLKDSGPNRFHPLFSSCAARVPGEQRPSPAFITAIDLDAGVVANRQVLTVGPGPPAFLDISEANIIFGDISAMGPDALFGMLPEGDGHQLALDWEASVALAAIVKHAGVETLTEPKNYKEMLQAEDVKQWMASVENELDSHEKNGTFTPTLQLPSGYVILNCTWVFKVKLNPDMSLDKRKSRMVIQGCLQGTDSYNYAKTFAPTPSGFCVKVMLNLCFQMDLPVFHADVPVAFQIPKLDEKLAVRLPQGLTVNGCNLAILNKSVYGLKQAAHSWRAESHNWIMAYDPRIKVCQKDVCFYYIWDKSVKMLLVNYVDDYAGGCSDSSWWSSFMLAFKDKFNIKDLGQVEQLLGMGITRTSTTMELRMTKNIHLIANKYGLQDCKPVKTPMDVGGEHLLPLDCAKVDALPFLELLGELMWIGRNTRPDVLYVLKVLARFSNSYTAVHFQALRRVAKYLETTASFPLTFRKQPDFDMENIKLSLYTDSDWAGDKSTRRSTSGWLLLMCDNPIHFGSLLQKTVALSTAEAELMALTEGLKDLQFASQMLNEITVVATPSRVHVDNQGAKALAVNDVTNGRSRHIDIRHFYCRDLVRSGAIVVGFVQSADNVADLMTKALSEPVHSKLTKIVLNM
jgi:hypothetical protein